VNFILSSISCPTHSVFGLYLITKKCLWSQYPTNRIWEFRRICNFDAVGDKDKPILDYWCQKVKGQGHDETNYVKDHLFKSRPLQSMHRSTYRQFAMEDHLHSGPCSDVHHLGHSKNYWTELHELNCTTCIWRPGQWGDRMTMQWRSHEGGGAHASNLYPAELWNRRYPRRKCGDMVGVACGSPFGPNVAFSRENNRHFASCHQTRFQGSNINAFAAGAPPRTAL